MSILKVRDKDGNFVDIPVISGRPASIKVGEVKLLEPNSEPTIENVGTEYDAIFDFGIPKGEYIVQGEDFRLDLSDYAKQKQLDIEIENRQQKDNTLQSQINSLASGSPKGVYNDATALKTANPDTGVYVTTDNGHIYSWNKNQSGEPIDLGIYQATGLDNETKYTLSLSDSSLQHNNNIIYNMIDMTKVNAGYINTTGDVVYGGNIWYYTEYIPVVPGQKLILPNNNNALYDKNKTFVSSLQSATNTDDYRLVGYGFHGTNDSIRLLVVPDGCYYIRLTISQTKTVQHQMFEYTEENKDYFILQYTKNPVSHGIIKKPVNIKNEYLSDIVDEIQKNNIISSNLIKYVLPNTIYTKLNGYIQYSSTTSNFEVTNYIKCNAGDKYIVSDTATIVYMDSNYVPIKVVNNTDSDYPIETISGKKVLTMPENVSYIALHHDKSLSEFPYAYKILNEDLIDSLATPIDAKNSIYDMNLPESLKEILYRNIPKRSPLYGKTIDLFGDSITSTDYTMPYWGSIISTNTGCTINNYGISGTTLAHTDDRHLWDYKFTKLDATAIGYNKDDSSTWSTGNCFCERFSKVNNNADGIVIMGGTNDFAVKLGEWDSTDTSTFYGALNVLLQGISKRMIGKKILVCTPIQRATDYSSNVMDALSVLKSKTPTSTLSLQLRAEAIKQKCKQYGIHCLDLFNTSGINGIDDNKIYYRSGDDLHPSSYGQAKLATLIQNELEKMF